ncbi:WD repeat, SAM and U-box domain-containing protein 1 isoform X1 [Chelonia mydas]|uniref:WD repeat, SAM and U-box domain-containing protein 1 isoform X1 n=2 Tax=Chelonia mydas TaxID=8469 RepID=UPI0018A1D425|nr:WD repeat, SAM and U-box domain-containing protein 1 isoform X1 [Chelonia mydas]
MWSARGGGIRSVTAPAQPCCGVTWAQVTWFKADTMVKLIHTLADHSDDVNYCAFSSSCLATCSLDKTVRLYSLNNFTELPYSPLKGHTYAVHCCCFSPSGHILASCSTDGTTMLWNTHNGQTQAVLKQPRGSPVRVCRFSPDSAYLVSGAADGSIVLWNVQSLKLYRSGSVKDGSLMACAFSPNGNLFVTGSSCGDLTIWDDKMRCLYNEKGHDLGVTCCDFSSQAVSDGEQGSRYFRMASCGQDNQIKLWLISLADVLGCELKYECTLNGHSAPVLACAFSSDGQMLVSGSVDKSIIIHDTKTGSILHTLTQHTRYVTTCAFAPNIPLLATGSMDKTVNIWQFDPKQHCAGSGLEDEPKMSIENWSEEEVSVWLCAQGLKDLVGIFKMNNIDGKELLSLTKHSLTNDLKIESLGLRSKVFRKIEELRIKVDSVSLGIPDEFLCPITRELMKEPVIAADGYSYEKEAMENWISTKRRSSPMTNLPLQSLILTPNRTLKMAINRWLDTQQKYNETT